MRFSTDVETSTASKANWFDFSVAEWVDGRILVSASGEPHNISARVQRTTFPFMEVVMRRLSTISALAAGALAILFGAYFAQTPSLGPMKANASQAGFSPNALAGDTSLKTESWDAF
jgi:hypothetical protein